jgi:hypothetical protein
VAGNNKPIAGRTTMLAVPTIVLVVKAMAWVLVAILGAIFFLADMGRRGKGGTGMAIDSLQKEVARADALGPRDRATVLDRLRSGKF